MAKTRDYVMAEGKGYTDVCGTFFPAGAGVPTTLAANGASVGWSVVRASAGTFTITFAEKYALIVERSADIQMAAATDLNPQWGAFVAASGSTPASITLRTLTAGTATDIAANAANSVSFRIRFGFHGSSK